MTEKHNKETITSSCSDEYTRTIKYYFLNTSIFLGGRKPDIIIENV